jgi:hypothetical protein
MKQKELMNYHHHCPRRTVSMLLPTPVAFATPWWIVMQPTVGCSEKEGKIFFVLQKEFFLKKA